MKKYVTVIYVQFISLSYFNCIALMIINVICLVIEAEVKSRITTGEGKTKVIVKVKRVFKKRECSILLDTAHSRIEAALKCGPINLEAAT